ncbi:unnamed protein product [Cylindrotheca closterium]|uniref:MYND-type domain-containing protein n=1 Tax=Cylindrotheca closterium TaxID=2856 RepID=A0AAD2PUV7_9STRA|nr:unnamed protein product [Cylindrotheca closterium]
MSETKDYYEGKDKLWHDRWFEMFRKGKWMSNPDFSSTMSPEWDSYHPYSCNTCKRGGLQSLNLVRCSGCRVVKYCCRDHQKKDWPMHKSWCKAFSKVSDINDEADEKIDWTEWSRRQNETSRKIMNMVRGDLRHSINVQIAWVQPHCSRCFRSGRISGVDLVVCPSCNGVAVCKSCLGHETDTTWETFHNGDKQECESYLIYLCCSAMIVEHEKPVLRPSHTNCTETFCPKDWIDYFEKKGNDFGTWLDGPISALRIMAPIVCFLTDGLTLPMTIQMFLGELSLLKKSELSIHILGAEGQEFIATRAFLELGRLNPQLKRLDIVMVGPNLPNNYSHSYPQFVLSSEEAPCHLEGTVDHVSGLYHRCPAASGPVPDLFVAFNPGFQEPSHFVTWRSTLELVKTRTGVPLCITGFNFSEVHNDVKVLKGVGFQEKVPPTANPFRSTRPFLDPSREETDFIYNNKAYAIVQGVA